MFENDPMMKKLHEYRRKMHEETKNLPFEEQQKLLDERVQSFLSKAGYKLVDIGDGSSRIVKASNAVSSQK